MTDEQAKPIPAPWVVVKDAKRHALEIRGPVVQPHARNGEHVICSIPETNTGTEKRPVWGGWPADVEQSARRLVACVNACAGLETEQLETRLLSDIIDTARRAVDEAGHKLSTLGHGGSEQLEKLGEILATRV